jgi:hypothetical protein
MSFLTKLIGGAFVAGGIMMMFAFPEIADYQTHAFSKTLILIGVIMIAIGAGLLVI